MRGSEALTSSDVYALAVISWMRVGDGTTLERRRRKERDGEKVKRLGLLFRRVVPICSDLVQVDGAHNISDPIAHLHKQMVGSLLLTPTHAYDLEKAFRGLRLRIGH